MKSHGFNSERSEESTDEPQLQLRAKRGVNRRAAASTPSEARSQPQSRSFNSERSEESTDEPQLQLRAKRGVNRRAAASTPSEARSQPWSREAVPRCASVDSSLRSE